MSPNERALLRLLGAVVALAGLLVFWFFAARRPGFLSPQMRKTIPVAIIVGFAILAVSFLIGYVMQKSRPH